MKYLTLKNMEKATRMISDKGYEWIKANDMAIDCFEKSKQAGMSVDFFISKIIDNKLIMHKI